MGRPSVRWDTVRSVGRSALIVVAAALAALVGGCGAGSGHPAGAQGTSAARAPTLPDVRAQIAAIEADSARELAGGAAKKSRATPSQLATSLSALGVRAASTLDALTRIAPTLGTNAARAAALESLSSVQSALRVLSEAYSIGSSGVVVRRETLVLRRARARLRATAARL